MTDNRFEAPMAGDEVATLRGVLQYLRDTFRWKIEGLDDEQLQQPLAPSTMTLAGMTTHLAFVENYWFTYVFEGKRPLEVFADNDWDAAADYDWEMAAGMSPDQRTELLSRMQQESDSVVDAALTSGGLDLTAQNPGQAERVSLRWILVHLVEEYARHNGHADLLREAIDGQVGE